MDPDYKQYHNIVGTNLVQFPITNMNNSSNGYCHLLSVLSLLSSCDLLVVSVLDTVINKNYNSLPENTLGHFDKVNEKYVIHESIPDGKVYNNKNNAYFGDIEDDKDRNVSKSISIISSSKDLSEINKMFTTDEHILQELLKISYYIREFIVLDVGEDKRRIYIPDPLRFGTLLCTYGYFNLIPTVYLRRPSHYMDIIMRILKRYPGVIGFINKRNTIQGVITKYKPIYLFIGFQEVKQEFEAGIERNEKQDYLRYKTKFGRVNAIKEFECNGILYELVGQTVCAMGGRHSGNVFMLSRGEKPFDHNDEETFDIPILFDSVEAPWRYAWWNILFMVFIFKSTSRKFCICISSGIWNRFSIICQKE